MVPHNVVLVLAGSINALPWSSMVVHNVPADIAGEVVMVVAGGTGCTQCAACGAHGSY